MAKPTLQNTDRLTEQPIIGDLEDVCEDLLDDNGFNHACNRSKTDESCLNRELYLSLVWNSGHLGIAYYDVSSPQIYVMPDTPENDDFFLMKQIIREVQPRVIVLSSFNDNRFLGCLKKQISGESPMESNSCKLEFMSNSDFSYEVSKRRIFATQIPSLPQHFSDEERKLYYSSLLKLESVCMVRAAGGLLKYLDKMRVGVELEDTSTHVSILGFRVFTLESLIQIDMRTYFALNIFRIEFHPSVYKIGAYSSKEGLSLFGILNRCKSSVGSRMLRQWFLRPLRNAPALRQRYDAVSFFLKPCNMETVTSLHGCLKHIKYIPRILLRMSKAQASIGDWIALSKTLYHAVYIGETCRALPQTVDIFRRIGIAFPDDLHCCYNILCKTMDFEASKQSKKFEVQANVNEKLDAKKCTFNGLPDLMNQVAREELKTLSDDIKACVVSYLPQIGYLLVIDMPEGMTETDDYTIDGLEFKFASDNQLFYKSPRTLELDRILGDIQLEILDMEVAIMHHLQDTILEKSQLILDVMELAAELDCLMALAACANEFGYICPTLVEETVIDIRNGRHPLQELCCSSYVPNHTSIGEQFRKMKLLTGPNACGKSIYLKQIGLIVFMSHIGSFVPAEHVRIGPVDKIFSCIKAVESVSAGLSTFMQDNIQVSDAVRMASSNSLVLIDEFGKGTESTDGLALLTAVIKFWIAKGSACPMVLFSTHFHSIIQQKLLPPSTQLQFLTFETVMNGEELVFLYQIKEGHTSSSYACNIASQVGLPAAIIKRAKVVSDLLAHNKTVPPLRNKGSNLQNERYEKIVSAFLKLNLDTDDVKAFLRDIVLPLSEDPQQKQRPVVSSESVQCVPEVSHIARNNVSLTGGEKGKAQSKCAGSITKVRENKGAASTINISSTKTRRSETYGSTESNEYNNAVEIARSRTMVIKENNPDKTNTGIIINKSTESRKMLVDNRDTESLGSRERIKGKQNDALNTNGSTRNKLQSDNAECTESAVNINTSIWSEDPLLAQNRQVQHPVDSSLIKNQDGSAETRKCLKDPTSKSTCFFRSYSSMLKEQFTKTPLLENSEAYTCKPPTEEHDVSITKNDHKSIAQDQSKLYLTADKHMNNGPAYCAGTKTLGKRKIDMRFLFNDLSKQKKSYVLSSSHTETSGTDQPAMVTEAVKQGEISKIYYNENKSSSGIISPTSEIQSIVRYEEKHKAQTSNITISPVSETQSIMGYEKKLKAHLSSLEEPYLIKAASISESPKPSRKPTGENVNMDSSSTLESPWNSSDYGTINTKKPVNIDSSITTESPWDSTSHSTLIAIKPSFTELSTS